MQYFEPNFLDEALVLLDRFGSNAGVLAGGTRVGPALRQGKECAALVNIKRIGELHEIASSERTLRIGATATAAAMRNNPDVQAQAPLLQRAAASMGSVQLQNLATLGGNICSGDPASDLSVALLACAARCELAASHEGTRMVDIESLLARKPAVVRHDELLVGVEVPIAKEPVRCSYQKMTTRRSFEMALVAVAFWCSMKGEAVREARIAIAGAGPIIYRSRAAEATLVERPLDENSGKQAGLAAAAEVQAATDLRAGAAYRRNLVATLVGRAVLAAGPSTGGDGRA